MQRRSCSRERTRSASRGEEEEQEKEDERRSGTLNALIARVVARSDVGELVDEGLAVGADGCERKSQLEGREGRGGNEQKDSARSVGGGLAASRIERRGEKSVPNMVTKGSASGRKEAKPMFVSLDAVNLGRSRNKNLFVLFARLLYTRGGERGRALITETGEGEKKTRM
jgi:hypothetical protein